MITHIMTTPNQIHLLLILMTLPIKNLNCWLETWLVIWLVFSENPEREQLPLHALVSLLHPHPLEFSPEEMFNLKDSQRDSTLLSNPTNKLYYLPHTKYFPSYITQVFKLADLMRSIKTNELLKTEIHGFFWVFLGFFFLRLSS